ncbi:1-(5-phosphoribosyl)-5-((5-phosphoribosylamino)methylideneamino)imidazole-4-carboxamide isomerase [Candidatus Dojkabacteria bacterium]|nr:1-(5-phosphoribosyl)-5-((5-phosphoribosylamino)methylideneamino)imidazole-4-carboxamide isomerase [Candidatus Dojkabacteria bacterium]
MTFSKMNDFQIIPAIDIIDGKCVRLTKGNYKNKSVYPGSPLEQAKKFESDGYRRLHIIDLDAARLGRSSNGLVIKQIIENTNLSVQVGGGFRTSEKINKFISSGADQIIVSSALFYPQFDWTLVNVDKITASIDSNRGRIVTNGWLKGENIDTKTVIKMLNSIGISRVIVTDVRRDGTLLGPNTKLAREFKNQFGKEVLLAGGIRGKEDIQSIQLVSLDGVIIGKALYEH